MTRITDELLVRGNRIKNRIVMPPMVTFSFRGDNGFYFGQQHVEHYAARAKGGAGLIIVQATRVAGAAGGTDSWAPENGKVLKQIAEQCHAYGATVMMQLFAGDVDTDINELSVADIKSMQLDMTQAAILACDMGYDGVEYHFAHSFTLCRFLDGAYNRRPDQYGGDATGRTRILTEILPTIRDNTQEKFMVSVRMGEYAPTHQDGVEAAKIFEQAGLDLLHISFGMKQPVQSPPAGFSGSPIAYSGCNIKKEVAIPVIAVNEIRTREQVCFLIENDYVDLVAVGRGMFADPEFANHVIQGGAIQPCRGCGGSVESCFWFSDHRACPARQA